MFFYTYINLMIPSPIKANPGGEVDPKTAIGRASLVQFIWETLEQQNIRMTAERRIGKTTVLKIMRTIPAEGWTPIFLDLERCSTALEFAMTVYQAVDKCLTAKHLASRRTRELFKWLQGVEVKGLFKFPEKADVQWKEVLTLSIEDLLHECATAGTKPVFLCDEVPFMIANIRDKEGERTAMEILDLLRSLRQTHSGLRMIITGSIGLHHVLTSLKDKDYGNAPVNDMFAVEVPPFEEADARQLASLLIQGEGLACNEADATCASIASHADRFPFYIQHIVKALKSRSLAATPANVEQVFASHMVDANDPWELRHYRERIPTYYGSDEGIVRRILDHLALASDPVSVADIFSMLKGSTIFDDREKLLRLLTLLERDHYLERSSGTGHYQFRFPLVRRWWRLDRGL